MAAVCDKEADKEALTEVKSGTDSPNNILNKTFARNILKQADDHNRIKSDKESTQHRKFINIERKKHTIKNLNKKFGIPKTMYSDFISSSSDVIIQGNLKAKKKVITPFDQVRKLVTDAAEFEQKAVQQEEQDEEFDSTSGSDISFRRNLVVKKKVITPFQQVRKLVTDAAEFDQQQDDAVIMEQSRQQDEEFDEAVIEEDIKRETVSAQQRRRNRITVDKTLLRNHLKHTNIHNRLKEEDEMWDQHKLLTKRKIGSLTSRSARQSSKKRGGTMYSDREPGKVKPSRITSAPYIGEWTLKLLEAKEDDPDKWGHTGFKEIHAEELKKVKIKKSRIVLSDTDNSDYTDSTAEEISSPDTLTRRVVRKEKGKLNGKQISNKKYISARTVIMNTLLSGTDQSRSTKRPKTVKSERKSKREVTQGFRSDKLDIQKKGKTIIRNHSPKWGHDGFYESSDDATGVVNVPSKCKMKSLAVVKPIVKVDEDEWTEKTVESKKQLPKKERFVENSKEVTVWRRLREEDNVKTGVNRASLKNSIHKNYDNVEGKRKVLATKRKIKEEEEDSARAEKHTTSKRVVKKHARRSLSSENSDSSFTDSSSDGRYKKAKKKKKKQKKTYKATFSDYDSDFKPKD